MSEETADTTPTQMTGLSEALHFLTTEVDENTKMRGNVKVHLAVEKITKDAMEDGLSAVDLRKVLNVILSTHIRIAQPMRWKLIKCLIPKSTISEDVVQSVIFYISPKILHTPGPSNTEVFLLRWVLLVFDYLETHDGLHKLYSLVFLFINSAKLMPYACHLLFLLTRNCDVKMFRVQQLMSLMEKMGPHPALIGLLTCYKVFKPNMVPIKMAATHKVFFKTHDANWKAAIVAMVSKCTSNNDPAKDNSIDMERHRSMPTYVPKSKRQKMCLPDVHNASKEIEEVKVVSDMPEVCGTIPYQNVESFLHFVESIDKIEYPSQIAACLQDPRLRLLMSCNPDQVAITRLCLWIQHFLVFGFKGNGMDESGRSETLLKMLLKFSQTVKTLPVVHGFLEGYLPRWNGRTHAELIVELVSCINPCSFQDLQTSILDPLTRLFFASDVYFKSMYVVCMGKLISNFSFHLYALQSFGNVNKMNQSRQEESRRGKDGESFDGQIACQNKTVENDHGTSSTNTNSSTAAAIATSIECLHKLIEFLDVTMVVGLRMEGDHLLLQQTISDVLRVVSTSDHRYRVPMTSFPTRVIQRLLLSQYSVIVTQLCGILNSYRQSLMSRRHNQGTKEKTLLSLSTTMETSLQSTLAESTLLLSNTRKFNAVLIDTFAMLWLGFSLLHLSKLFNMDYNDNLACRNRKTQYQSMFQFSHPPNLQERIGTDSLNIYKNPAFIALAYKFLKETQREGKKLHPSMIKDHREVYLKFLERERFPQILELVNMNLKSRKSKKSLDHTTPVTLQSL